MASIVSVNVGRTADLATAQGTVPSAIVKRPAAARVLARGVALDGDDQADLAAHGGYDRAIYAYASEDYAWFANELGRSLEPGIFGENLTTEGIDLDGLPIGARVRAGDALLEVAQPRIPCFKLAARLNDPTFVKTFARALRPGTYLRIVEEGSIGVGDPLVVASRPAHDLSPRAIAEIYFFRQTDAARMLAIPDGLLSDGWRSWAHARVRPS